jgi:general secretion pathway protein J
MSRNRLNKGVRLLYSCLPCRIKESDPFIQARGFTLIELLVALAIFALLAAFAYRGLNLLLESRAALANESRKWRDVSLFVGRVERDLGAVLNRRAKNTYGTDTAPVTSVVDLGPNPAPGLSLTRSGGGLYDNALAAPQRVAYRFADGHVDRLAWPAVDSAPRVDPATVPVLDNVRALAFRFLDGRGEWRPTWGLPGSPDAMPNAVEMTLELATGERIVRLMDLPVVGT